MKNELLQKSRHYEEAYGNRISHEERPFFHITPWVGWMNDPNGFSLYKGEYHLFYQYHPYDTAWGPMHWGHLKTKDLIRWERLPLVLAPEESYDDAGCFSGSAVEMPDGTHAIMYTGVRKVMNEEGYPEERQVQCMAYGDGIDYRKYEGNPVLTAADLPEGGSEIDFRDPKMWYDEEEKCYYSVVGNRPADGSGSVLLFRSVDTKKWERMAVLDGSKNCYGRMWECPDFFRLDGVDVILTSPQEMRTDGIEFHNGNGKIYVTGSYDKKTHTFQRREVHAIEYGLDFYAPQTVLSEDGRRIMIAWMQAWESSRCVPREAKWFGMLTIPRELHMVDGRLIQNPVRELEAYRCDLVSYQKMEVNGKTCFPEISGRCLDMIITVRPAEEDPYREVIIRVAEDQEYHTDIRFDPDRNQICFDRTNAGFRYDIVETRKFSVRDRNGEIKLRIVMDKFSVEIFVNDGEQAMTATIYTPQTADGITFETIGKAVLDVEKYNLKFE